MHRMLLLAVAVGLAVGAPAAGVAQDPAKPPAAAQAPPAKAGPSIAWTKGFDEAMKAMGADETPVILYFTYDT